MLAFMPKSEVQAVLDRRGLTHLTEYTITDATALWAELERVRMQGYAIDEQESAPEVRCVGAPLFDYDASVVAAISASGPAFRLTPGRVPDIARAVVTAAQAISRELGCPPVTRTALTSAM